MTDPDDWMIQISDRFRPEKKGDKPRCVDAVFKQVNIGGRTVLYCEGRSSGLDEFGTFIYDPASFTIITLNGENLSAIKAAYTVVSEGLTWK
jgi:hypothetical protein